MKKIHFIGIGGIGVSALAKYYLGQGFYISGSDLVSSEITEDFVKKGIKVSIGEHRAENIEKDLSLVVYSPAVEDTNPEIVRAQELGIDLKSYPEALGKLTKNLYTIAVSGTHGKSTTVAMLGILLEKAGLDPTVIVGTKVREFGDSNCRIGKSKYLVIEACEWDASFLNYSPNIIALTNIEKEHMDFFKDLDGVFRIYKDYVNLLSSDGILVANKDDENIKKVLKDKKVEWYSLKEAKELKKVLKVPGDHNAYNALAALTVARTLGIPDKVSFEALSLYQGAWRRFDVREGDFEGKEVTVINDYAHHPTELRVTLASVKEKFPKKKVIAVFQPHQYLRTHYLFDDFIKVLSQAPFEQLIITDIYDVAGREESLIKDSVSSQKLVEEVIYIPSIEEVVAHLKKELEGGEVILIMGAGDIYELSAFFHLTSNK